ncbi:MAG: hypothetical protein K2Q24_14230 [Chitinophagaceae bacterium]|nr:hypothetical protein [Chitinophagaceae bacterium]
MKRFITLLLLFTAILPSYAQNTFNAFATRINYIFQYIDKSQVPSGYLDEYGPQFAEKKWHKDVCL